MSEMYVIIGGQQLKESREEGLKRPGLVKLLVDEDVLENTYKEFFEECHGYIANTHITPSKEPTVELLKGACNCEDDSYQIFVYNRNEKNGGIFDLESSVQDTVGEYIYRTELVEQGKRVDLETLEMYILGTPMGG